MKRINWAWALASFLLAACATDGRQAPPPLQNSQPERSRVRVHLDTSGGRPLILFAPPLRSPVEVTQVELETAMARLAVDLDLPPCPTKQLVLLPREGPGEEAEAALTRSYLRWCERRGSMGDCLSLLAASPYLGPEARHTLALRIALGAVWEGAVGAVEGMVSQEALEAAVMSTLAGVLAVLVLPEPTMKAVAVALVCYMVGYLGLDTVWGLLEGWTRLKQESERARTFVELREAAERFGRLMGEKSARVLVLLATAAIGSTANLMMKGPGLPGFTQAATMARMQAGINLAALNQIRAVAVALPEGSLTLTLAPGALAMAARGTSGGGQAAPSPPSSRYLLRDIEPWRKPRFTSDGKLIPYKDTRNPPQPIVNLGKNRAGQTVQRGKHTLEFDAEGFPRFETQFETLLDDIHIGSGRPAQHFRAANARLAQAIEADPALARQLGLSPADVELLRVSDAPPQGYLWHHHQDVGRMQLIQRVLHKLSLPHTGGMAIWGGGY
ncbi:HNH endonuclease [Archangium gephyra]|uniref:SitA5 family polymorphic toxin n=1 Tax=Archangium gephyra TaxID=48 RepID=UPI0035D40B64